jgi:hypothetical protein
MKPSHANLAMAPADATLAVTAVVIVEVTTVTIVAGVIASLAGKKSRLADLFYCSRSNIRGSKRLPALITIAAFR